MCSTWAVPALPEIASGRIKAVSMRHRLQSNRSTSVDADGRDRHLSEPPNSRAREAADGSCTGNSARWPRWEMSWPAAESYREATPNPTVPRRATHRRCKSCPQREPDSSLSDPSFRGHGLQPRSRECAYSRAAARHRDRVLRRLACAPAWQASLGEPM